MNHTKEPWEYVEERNIVNESKVGEYTIITHAIRPFGKTGDHNICRLKDPIDAKRIVQCVNDCAGMKDPGAEIAKLRADRAELLEALKWLRNSYLDVTNAFTIAERGCAHDQIWDAVEQSESIIKRMGAGE